jgi:hypothetical protein
MTGGLVPTSRFVLTIAFAAMPVSTRGRESQHASEEMD